MRNKIQKNPRKFDENKRLFAEDRINFLFLTFLFFWVRFIYFSNGNLKIHILGISILTDFNLL